MITKYIFNGNDFYEYIDENGNIVGIEVEIIKMIAEKLNMQLEIKNIDFSYQIVKD